MKGGENKMETKLIAFRLPVVLYKKLIKEAEKENLLLSEYLRDVIREYLEEKENNEEEEEEEELEKGEYRNIWGTGKSKVRCAKCGRIQIVANSTRKVIAHQYGEWVCSKCR